MITRQRTGIEKLDQQAKQYPILKCFSKKCGKAVPNKDLNATFNVKELNFQDKVKLLLPGVDYFNTNLRHNNAEQVISQQDFRVLATEDIKKVGDYFVQKFESLPNDEEKSRFEKILKKFELFGFQYIRLDLDPEKKLIDLDFISNQIEKEVLKDAIEIIESNLSTQLH
eukprot:gene7039-11204_t